MADFFDLDGVKYKIADLSDNGRNILDKLTFANLKIHELKNQGALLTKAKNAYISDIKTEIIQGESGIDFNDLFDE